MSKMSGLTDTTLNPAETLFLLAKLLSGIEGFENTAAMIKEDLV